MTTNLKSAASAALLAFEALAQLALGAIENATDDEFQVIQEAKLRLAALQDAVQGSETTLSTLHQQVLLDLKALAAKAPFVTDDWVAQVATMDPVSMRRRLIASYDWHGHYAHSLDGIEEIKFMPGAAPDGCWSHKEVRSVVQQLVAEVAGLRAKLLAESGAAQQTAQGPDTTSLLPASSAVAALTLTPEQLACLMGEVADSVEGNPFDSKKVYTLDTDGVETFALKVIAANAAQQGLSKT